MKIYTRSGDDGKTGILGKSRLDKDNARIAAYGSVDELNAYLGYCTSLYSDIIIYILDIQKLLFEIGTELAYEEYKELIYAEDVKNLETLIDQSEGQLPPLTSFILPGGGTSASQLHIARTICRRVERDVVAFSRENRVNPNTLAYLNRLSDLLFSWARLQNHRSGIAEKEWSPRR